jgi:hypothetical protein
MILAKPIVRLLGPLTLVVAAGCSAAYHDYSECRVPCKYCPPPPLPYMQYDCACHSCAASQYLTERAELPDSNDATTEEPEEVKP